MYNDLSRVEKKIEKLEELEKIRSLNIFNVADNCNKKKFHFENIQAYSQRVGRTK